MRFAIATFGCKTNPYESEAMRESLARDYDGELVL